MKQIMLCLVMIFFCATVVFSQSSGKVTSKVKKAVIQQMIDDGEISKECVSEVSDITELVSVETEKDLNGDGKPEYFVMGTHACTSASDRSNAWYYRKTPKGYALLAFLPRFEFIKASKTKTKGYYNLQVTRKSGTSSFDTVTYKFDGSRYQEQ